MNRVVSQAVPKFVLPRTQSLDWNHYVFSILNNGRLPCSDHDQPRKRSELSSVLAPYQLKIKIGSSHGIVGAFNRIEPCGTCV